MKILKTAICFVFVAVMFTACQDSKEKLTEKIKTTEQEISTDFSKKEKREQLVDLYKEYVSRFPKDSLAAEYLFKSATLYVSLRKGDEALSAFTNLINRYPKSDYLPQAYYYIGFVYEDVIYDIIAAKVAYTNFIEKYPYHELVNDAKLSIRYLGKSPQEIVDSFEKEETNIITDKE